MLKEKVKISKPINKFAEDERHDFFKKKNERKKPKKMPINMTAATKSILIRGSTP